MAKLLIGFILLGSLNAFGLSVITDLDDTVKITNVENKPRAVWNALFSKKAFKGMPDLLSEMGRNGSDLYIVSASPNLLNSRIESFLEFQKLSVRQVYTRKLSELGKKEEYKLNSIREILNTSGDDFILIGDNTEIDAKVYSQIKAEFPQRIKAVYIHQVAKNKPIVHTPYFSFYDIAVGEYKAGRISSIALLDMAKDIVLWRNMEEAFPTFKLCPTELEVFDTDIPFFIRQASKQVYNRIIKHCSNRLK